VGNWLGAGATALSALVVTGVLGLVMALVAKPADFGVGNTLTLATAIAVGSFGSDLVMQLDDEVETTVSLGIFPLTVTLIVLTVALLVFRRVIRDYRSSWDALADAARAALIFGLGLTIPALVFRSDNDDTGRGWGRAISKESFGETDFGSHAGSAFFLGFLILFLVLGLAVVVRSGWVHDGFRRVRDWAVAPLYGHATTFALLPLVGFLGWLLLGFGEESVAANDPTGDDLQALLTLIFGLFASGGLWVMSLGAGAAVGSSSDETDAPGESEWYHLWGQVTDDEPGLWAAPLLLLAALAVSAFVVVRKSPAGTATRGLGLWVASLLVVVPLMVRLSGGHLSAEASYLGEDYESSLYFGAHGVQTTFFLTGIAVLVALAVAGLTRTLDLRALARDVSSGLRKLQSAPAGTSGSAPTQPPPYSPPPSGRPPSGPPPGPPPSAPPG